MIKIILGIILALAISALGISKSLDLHKRVSILKELADAFDNMSELVRLYRPSQMKLFENIANNKRFSNLDIFPKLFGHLKHERNIKNAYNMQINKSNMRDYLANDELCLLEEFFCNTAYLDYDGYLKGCKNISYAMGEIAKVAASEYKQKGKLMASLGILGGIFLFIVII